jgi:hypothetical protein
LITAYTINSACLLGFDYTWNSSDFQHGFSLKILYKYIRDKQNYSFQITGVWHTFLLKNRVSFSGFADFWREDFSFGSTKTKYVFISEPQFWFNVTKKIYIGSEIRIYYNFGGIQDWQLNPTLALKWDF